MEQDKTVEAQQETRCEVCGHVIGTPKVLTDDVKKDYLASILGDRNFEHTYQLMGGALTLVFEAPKGDVLKTQARFFDLALAAEDPVEKNKLFDYALLMFTLKDVSVTVNEVRKSVLKRDLNTMIDITKESLIQAYNDILQHFDQALIINLRLCARLFNELQNKLALTGLDENFWQGVGQH